MTSQDDAAPIPASFDGARYVYGVLASEEVPKREARGLLGRAVRFLHRDGLAAAVTDVDGPVPGRREDLLAYFRVLEELAGGATVLPLRFGTVFDSDDEVVLELLVRRRALLDRLLSELHGMVELSVRALYERDLVLAEILAERRDIRRLSERTRGLPEEAVYFDRIRLGELVAEALEGKRERDAEDLIARLARVAVAVERGTPATERGVLSASFLVSRDRVPAFEDVVGSLQSEMGKRMQLRVTGPLPPYSFVSIIDDPVPAGDL